MYRLLFSREILIFVSHLSFVICEYSYGGSFDDNKSILHINHIKIKINLVRFWSVVV